MDKRAKEPMAFPPPSAVEASRNGEVNYDIDEIFKTRAIPEVKAIQRRLQFVCSTVQGLLLLQLKIYLELTLIRSKRSFDTWLGTSYCTDPRKDVTNVY